MRIAALVVAAVVGIAVVSVQTACGPSGSCVRYSDCAEGYTCIAGVCVSAPAGESSSNLDAAAGDVGDVSFPSLDVALPSIDVATLPDVALAEASIDAEELNEAGVEGGADGGSDATDDATGAVDAAVVDASGVDASGDASGDAPGE